jgi:probable rRNA maturation factor
MILHLETNNKSKSPIKKDIIDKIVRKTLKGAGFDFLKNKEISLSVALVGAKEIKELNKKFRKIDEVTDVLSFAEYEDTKSLKKEKEPKIFLGELILCYNEIAGYAKKKKMKIKNELAEVISHGVLHLLGFEHGDKMFAIQKKVAGSF